MYNTDDYNKFNVYTGSNTSYYTNYYKDESINQSAISEFINDPGKFWEHSILNPNSVPKKTSSAMTMGSFYHAMIESRILKSNKPLNEYQIIDNSRLSPKRKKELLELYPNKLCIKQQDYDKCNNAINILMEHEKVKEILNVDWFKTEQEVYWVEPITEGKTCYMTHCKAKLDFYSEYCLVDWKSTRANSYDEFEMSIRKYKYDLQAAWYSRALMRLDNFVEMSENELTDASPFGESIGRRKCIIIAQNLNSPHTIIPYEFNLDTTEELDDYMVNQELPELRKFIINKRKESINLRSNDNA